MELSKEVQDHIREIESHDGPIHEAITGIATLFSHLSDESLVYECSRSVQGIYSIATSMALRSRLPDLHRVVDPLSGFRCLDFAYSQSSFSRVCDVFNNRSTRTFEHQASAHRAFIRPVLSKDELQKIESFKSIEGPEYDGSVIIHCCDTARFHVGPNQMSEVMGKPRRLSDTFLFIDDTFDAAGVYGLINALNNCPFGQKNRAKIVLRHAGK